MLKRERGAARLGLYMYIHMAMITQVSLKIKAQRYVEIMSVSKYIPRTLRDEAGFSARR